jgi:cyclic di-GMP phosphodiesterase
VAGERILLVEDNEVLREGLSALLENEDYSVQGAGNGREALDRMKKTIPDLIIADIIMPEMDGYAFFEAVRSKQDWIAIPFIFLTARREKKFILAGKGLGAEDYLLKPVAPDDLLIAIRSRLGRNQELLYAQLQQTYEASLIMLANAIEVRDVYTRGHVERVMNYAQAIADQLGWSSIQINSLRYGSILHDIGKIFIPEAIIRKDGPLDSGEWREMQKHPQFGADLIQDIDYLSGAIPVILYHHERWNGGGYPFGLEKDEIPINALIVSIADSFDAMTTVRPYREELTPEEAYAEILSCSGIQYDPDVVKAFQLAWEENKILEIYKAFP